MNLKKDEYNFLVYLWETAHLALEDRATLAMILDTLDARRAKANEKTRKIVAERRKTNPNYGRPKPRQ